MLQARLQSRAANVAISCVMGTLLAMPIAQADQSTSAQGDSPAPKTIVLINPNSNTESTRSMADLARLETEDVAKVVEATNSEAPPLLTSPQDMIDAAPGVVALGMEAAKQGEVDAIIVSAFSDPGLEELRDSVDIPVFGIGEEVFHEAARGNREFGIVTVTPDEALIDSFREKAASLGYAELYLGVRVTPGEPTELVQSAETLDAALADAVKASVEKDGAEAVIMGGGPLSASAMRLQPAFDIPLLVAVKAAARAAVDAITQEP